jgi:octanoyl-[GcvH]:protein N-octanoyltransferase
MELTKLAVSREGFADIAARSTAVARAVLLRVAQGELPATFRLHQPGRILAFSKQDAASPGFAEAVRAARRVGFEPVVRLAGGRAAVYHEGTLALSWAVPDPRPSARTEARFLELAEMLRDALTDLGVDARIGEVPREYCPGAWSVNARGQTKLAGTGQRLIAGAAHRGAVIVVDGGDLVREALLPVYEALGLDWDPATAGSVEDEVGDVTTSQVADAILARLGQRYELTDTTLDPETLALAEALESEHETARLQRSPRRPRPGRAPGGGER